MILLIDNYDSFVFNLARYIEELGGETLVVRNDAITVEQIARLSPDGMVLSPGPCTPREAGVCIAAVRALSAQVPMLGVCLGHQAIAAALGGEVVRGPEPVHGRTSQITHDDRGLFAGLPNPLTATRYHSLIVDEPSLPDELKVTARNETGLIMGLSHTERPLHGVQFHPESILTEGGHQLLSNFLRLCQVPVQPVPAPEYVRPVPSDDFFSQPIAPDAGPRR